MRIRSQPRWATGAATLAGAACARTLLLATCAGTLLLAACETLAPGDDPYGKTLKEPANKVLTAIEQYKQEQGRYPNSLYELVPKYVDKLPADPSLRIDEYTGTLRYAYSREWPRLGRIICIAHFGETDWTCEEN